MASYLTAWSNIDTLSAGDTIQADHINALQEALRERKNAIGQTYSFLPFSSGDNIGSTMASIQSNVESLASRYIEPTQTPPDDDALTFSDFGVGDGSDWTLIPARRPWNPSSPVYGNVNDYTPVCVEHLQEIKTSLLKMSRVKYGAAYYGRWIKSRVNENTLKYDQSSYTWAQARADALGIFDLPADEDFDVGSGNTLGLDLQGQNYGSPSIEWRTWGYLISRTARSFGDCYIGTGSLLPSGLTFSQEWAYGDLHVPSGWSTPWRIIQSKTRDLLIYQITSNSASGGSLIKTVTYGDTSWSTTGSGLIPPTSADTHYFRADLDVDGSDDSNWTQPSGINNYECMVSPGRFGLSFNMLGDISNFSYT